MNPTNRYSRQTILPEIGAAGQERLSKARVLVVGAGGLGCPVLQYLAAAGIGTIGVVDDDTVDISNLQRQTLFTTAQQGQPKAEAAAAFIRALNPDVTVDTHVMRLRADNALALMGGYDIVIDGTDNFAAQYLINDAAVKLGKPVVYGAILGFEGQACVFWAARGACYRCLHPAPPAGHIPNCAEAGTIGALAGIVGSVQAMEAIRLASGNPALMPESGALWLIDARNMQTHTFKIPKNPDCPVCGKPPGDIVLVDTDAPACTVIPEITPDMARKAKDHVFIDVRDQNEWDAGHIEGALHFPLSALERGETPEIPADRPCIVYCHAGPRSRAACEILSARGFGNLLLLRGGFAAW